MIRWSKIILITLFVASSAFGRTQLTFSKNEELLAKLSRAFMGELYASGRLLNDPLDHDYLQTMADRLLAKTHDSRHRYRFFLLSADDINAFAAPGGAIVVNTGLIQAANNQDEVAAVLAHEIMHVKQEHLLQSLDHAQDATVPLIANGLAAIALGMINPALGSGLLMMGSAGILQGEINYTREHESDSDHLGIRVLHAAGYNPDSMAKFFQRLEEQTRLYDTDNIPPMLRSHPMTTSRIAEANDRAREFPHKLYPMDPLYPYFKERINVQAHNNPQDLYTLYARQMALGDDRPVARYGYALAAIRALQFAKAQKVLNELHEEFPQNEFIALGLVDSYLDADQIEPGLALAKKLLDADPGRRLFQYYGADAYVYAHKPKEALELLEKLIKADPENTQYWILKAEAHRLAKQSPEAYYAYAQALYIESMDKTALKHFKTALKFSRKGSGIYQLAQQKVQLLSHQ